MIRQIILRAIVGAWGVVLGVEDLPGVTAPFLNRPTPRPHKIPAYLELSASQQCALEAVMLRCAGKSHAATSKAARATIIDFCGITGVSDYRAQLRIYTRNRLARGLAPRTVANRLLTLQQFLGCLGGHSEDCAEAARDMSKNLTSIAAHLDRLQQSPAALNAAAAFVPAAGESSIRGLVQNRLQHLLG